MRTDYRAHGYAERYRRARGLSAEATDQWRELLAGAVPAESVEVVIDAGAGVGRFWPVLATAWKPGIIVALEASGEMLAESALLPEVRRLVCDFTRPPLKEGSADVVFCSMSLHHAPDPAQAVRTLRRLLRPGGWLVMRTGTTETVSSFEFLHHFPEAERLELAAMPTVDVVEGWARHAGLSVESTTMVAAPTLTPVWKAWVGVCRRGFPSLQVISPWAFVSGTARYGAWLVLASLSGRRRARECSLMVVTRRP